MRLNGVLQYKGFLLMIVAKSTKKTYAIPIFNINKLIVKRS